MIKWNLVCASLHDVMKEILLGVEMETVNSETYNRYLEPTQNWTLFETKLNMAIISVFPVLD